MQLTFPNRPPLSLDRPRIMGVLNVTPDSFSDGGEHDTVDAAVRHALAMLREGADLIDVGGESSRPGSERIPADEQIARVVAVIRAVTDASSCRWGRLPACHRAQPETADSVLSPSGQRQAGSPPHHNSQTGTDPVSFGPLLSVDTTRAPVAAAALDAGASIINDISAGRDDPAILTLAAERGVPICLMHMQGTPGTMQNAPTYKDVVAEVEAFLLERRDAAVAAGIAPSQIILDPGIGFGKTFDHNLALLRALPRFVALGHPVLVGASRKRFLARLAGCPPEVKAEPTPYGGTAAVTALAVAAGVHLIRVHDAALNRAAADAAGALRHG